MGGSTIIYGIYYAALHILIAKQPQPAALTTHSLPKHARKTKTYSVPPLSRVSSQVFSDCARAPVVPIYGKTPYNNSTTIKRKRQSQNLYIPGTTAVFLSDDIGVSFLRVSTPRPSRWASVPIVVVIISLAIRQCAA